MVSRQTRYMALLAATAAGALAARRIRARHRYTFRGRVVLITGGTRGLGLALARQLADEGARLWIVARSADELGEALGELEARRGWVRVIRADIANPEAPARIVDEVVRQTGHIDVLVNNAGVITVAPFEHTQIEDFVESLDVHFWGALGLIRAALPHMIPDGTGRIVNISSIGGRIGVPHLSAYASGKFALTGLSESLRAELKREGILVTTVTPGLMRTGSYVNARIRGRHRKEARWFSLSSATPVSAISAARAARQILRAVRRGRATSEPNWRARVVHVASAVAPEMTAAAVALAAAWILPRPTPASDADQPRPAGTIEQGWARMFLPARTRRKYHQPRWVH